MSPITLEQFVDLESKRKKEIIQRAVIFANREQSRIMKQYKNLQKRQK